MAIGNDPKVLGTWKASPYQVTLYDREGQINAEVKKEKEIIHLGPEQIKWGILENTSQGDCIEKIKALALERIGVFPHPKEHPTELYIYETERAHFKIALHRLAQSSNTSTCFICFDVSDKNVGTFLREHLVPDLQLAGFKTDFCFQDLNVGDDLYGFMDKAATDDLVIVVCTKGLKEKVEERLQSSGPPGVAYEIALIRARAEAKGLQKTNVFCLYYNSKRAESCPLPSLQKDFGVKVEEIDDNWDMNYPSNAYHLLTSMKGKHSNQQTDREQVRREISAWNSGIADEELQKILAVRRNYLECSEADVEKIKSRYEQPINLAEASARGVRVDGLGELYVISEKGGHATAEGAILKTGAIGLINATQKGHVDGKKIVAEEESSVEGRAGEKGKANLSEAKLGKRSNLVVLANADEEATRNAMSRAEAALARLRQKHSA
ncbi:MAG: hypothetical protein KDK56_04515 [Simkania sp.]|nr:hypothetical protein [Simkania sp.]